MKVAINWLKELVDLKDPIGEVERLLPLRTIGTKEVTDRFIELDMKGYNRADLLSMRGVAYEVAAITNCKVSFQEADKSEYIWFGQNLPKVKVEIKDESLAPVYCAAKVIGLRVQPSPQEWVERLADAGLRSVNNIADITNLIMLEYGQPLHAFDHAEVVNETIVVRRAKEGEKMTTLDGKVRELGTGDLLIADPQKSLGIAGVMGGKEGEVSDGTEAIILEAAIFDPASLRKTVTKLGLQSEASKRFYHGLSKRRLFQALDAALKMIEELGGKVEALTIIDNLEENDIDVELKEKKVNSLIGIEVDPKFVEESLSKLNFEVAREGVASVHLEGVRWKVMPPYWRKDIAIEEDLIEEVARMYGYEKIPAKPLAGQFPAQIDQSLFKLIGQLKDTLVGLGLTEVQTYSFYSTKVLDSLGFDNLTKKDLIRVANPISSETEYLRQRVWPNLVEVIDQNFRRGFEDMAVFELGKVYSNTKASAIEERYSLAMALMNGSNNPIEELSAIFSRLNEVLKLGIEMRQDVGAQDPKWFHPTHQVGLEKDGQIVGQLVEVHPRVLDKFGVPKRVAVLEVEVEILLPLVGPERSG